MDLTYHFAKNEKVAMLAACQNLLYAGMSLFRGSFPVNPVVDLGFSGERVRIYKEIVERLFQFAAQEHKDLAAAKARSIRVEIHRSASWATIEEAFQIIQRRLPGQKAWADRWLQWIGTLRDEQKIWTELKAKMDRIPENKDDLQDLETQLLETKNRIWQMIFDAEKWLEKDCKDQALQHSTGCRMLLKRIARDWDLLTKFMDYLWIGMNENAEFADVYSNDQQNDPFLLASIRERRPSVLFQAIVKDAQVYFATPQVLRTKEITIVDLKYAKSPDEDKHLSTLHDQYYFVMKAAIEKVNPQLDAKHKELFG